MIYKPGYHRDLEVDFLRFLLATVYQHTNKPSDHLKAGIHYVCPDFCSNLQPGEVDASCLKSEQVCRFELTVFTEI